jgi:hypothetical protein
MLRLSLVVMFVMSLATLSFAASLAPTPAMEPVAGHPWIVTFE